MSLLALASATYADSPIPEDGTAGFPLKSFALHYMMKKRKGNNKQRKMEESVIDETNKGDSNVSVNTNVCGRRKGNDGLVITSTDIYTRQQTNDIATNNIAL